jgi:hypothetical protein
VADRSPACRLLAATSRASLTSRAANVPAACPASPSGTHIMHSQAPAARAYNYAKARACGLITAAYGGDMTGTNIKTAPRRGQEGAGHWAARAARPGRAS